MTTDELKAYYSSLLIIQYATKAKAVATIQALVEMVIMDQLPVAVETAYDIDTAEGVQLDTIGVIVGISRTGYIFSGAVALDDPDYRTILKLKIIENNSGSSLSDIQALIQLFFPGVLYVFDYRNMQMSYMFDSSGGNEALAEFFVKQNLLPKPMGVQLASLIFSADISHFFGFRTYALPGANNSPFNTYSDYESGRPWLSYTNAIVE